MGPRIDVDYIRLGTTPGQEQRYISLEICILQEIYCMWQAKAYVLANNFTKVVQIPEKVSQEYTCKTFYCWLQSDKRDNFFKESLRVFERGFFLHNIVYDITTLHKLQINCKIKLLKILTEVKRCRKSKVKTLEQSVKSFPTGEKS